MTPRSFTAITVVLLLHAVITAFGAESPGQDQTSVGELSARLGAEDWRDRLAAAKALGARGTAAAEAVQALANALEDSEGRVREAAAEALGALGAPSMPVLLEAVRNPKYEIRAAAAKALGRTGPGAAPALASALQDEKPFVRQRAAEGLAQIGAAAHEVLPALIQAFERTGEEAYVRCAVADAFAAMGKHARDAEPALTQALNDPQGWIRFHAVSALGQMAAGKPTLSFKPMTVALKDEEYEVRAGAAEVLGRYGPEAIPYLEAILADAASDIRPMAATGLTDVGTEALPALGRALQDPDVSVRRSAAKGLAWMGASAIPLLERSAQDEDETVRNHVQAGLEQARQVADLHTKLVVGIVVSVLLIALNIAYLIYVLRKKRRHAFEAAKK